MGEKLVVPRRRVRKDWYVGLSPDHADRTQNDVHDDSLNASILNTADQRGMSPGHLFPSTGEVMFMIYVERTLWSHSM